MSKRGAWLGSAAFFFVAPGTVAGLVPYLITGWDSRSPSVLARLGGAALVAGSVAVLLSTFAHFASDGRGTPAPVAPTAELVVGGLYRYVRNPMYLAVVGAIVGQALIFGRAGLLAYAGMVAASVFLFVHLYEEPTLASRYGLSYDRYRATVPGWWPRLHARD